MTRDKMMELLALLNPASAAALSAAGITDEHLEFALFHEAYHIKINRDRKDAEIEAALNTPTRTDEMQLLINNLSVVPTPCGVSIAIEENHHGVNGIEVCVSVDNDNGVLTVNAYENHGDEPTVTHNFDLN